MNGLEEQRAGLRQTEPERGDSHHRPAEDPLWDLVVQVIRLPALPVTQTATGAKVSTYTVERARAGTLTATTARAVEARAKLTAYAIKHARRQLRSAGVIDKSRKISPRAVLARYLEEAQRRQHARRPSADPPRRDPTRSGIRRERHPGELVPGQNARAGRRGVFVRRRAIALGVVATVGVGLFAVLRAAHVFGHDGPTIVHRSSSVVPGALTHDVGISAYLRSLAAARRAATRLQGIRAAELNAVIANVTSIAARGLLTPSRVRGLSLTLDRNREWWSSAPLPAPHQQVEFPGSRLVWQYYPGQGIELSPQASFATAHLLCTAGPAHLRACTELLSELIALAVNRSGRLAWEYYFNFDGGVPPWTSGLSQGTALQAFADAYRATKNSRYLAVGNRALALFTTAPPSGVAVQTPLGARYVEYSFDPAPGDEVLNAFLKSLIGLYEYAQVSKSPLAARLFAAGNAEAQAELPQFDTGSWSLYQPGVQDSVAYHELVIKLLQQLCAMTRGPIYCTTASNFESYLNASPQG
jgi:D-glucuronyl C5-epimerase-like protein